MTLCAQPGADRTSPLPGERSALSVRASQYPRISADHRASFSIKAPEAKKVQIDLGKVYDMVRDENGVPQGYDLIWRGVEITTGAQREHRYERLKQNIAEQGIDPAVMSEYLEFFRYGAPTHGGFGLGITRTLVKLFELPSVKDVTFLFRGPNRLKP